MPWTSSFVYKLAKLQRNPTDTTWRNEYPQTKHMEYVKGESIVIAWVKKKFSPFDKCSCFVCLRRQNKQKKISIRLSVCLDVCTYVRTWTFHVDTITFEGVSGSKQNLVGIFYVWNVGLILKSKVISWSWSWSWFWTEFWFSQNFAERHRIWWISLAYKE